MKVVFSYYAKNELEDAIEYYQQQSPGLGERFKKEVRRGPFIHNRGCTSSQRAELLGR